MILLEHLRIRRMLLGVRRTKVIGSISLEEVLDSSPVLDWPPLPQVEGNSVVLDWSLKTALHEALECASTDETRVVLNSAYTDVTEPQAGYIVGTNGRHLYAANSFALALSKSLIIPNEKLLCWSTFQDDGHGRSSLQDQGPLKNLAGCRSVRNAGPLSCGSVKVRIQTGKQWCQRLTA